MRILARFSPAFALLPFLLSVPPPPACGELVCAGYKPYEIELCEGETCFHEYTIPDPPVLGQSYIKVKLYEPYMHYEFLTDTVCYDLLLGQWLKWSVREKHWETEYTSDEMWWYDANWVQYDHKLSYDYADSWERWTTVTVMPEPATLSLFAFGALPFARRRR